MVVLTRTTRAGRKARLEKLWRQNMDDPRMRALIERAGTLSAVKACSIEPYGLKITIQPLDAEAASDVLDLLSKFALNPDESS